MLPFCVHPSVVVSHSLNKCKTNLQSETTLQSFLHEQQAEEEELQEERKAQTAIKDKKMVFGSVGVVVATIWDSYPIVTTKLLFSRRYGIPVKWETIACKIQVTEQDKEIKLKQFGIR